MPISRLTLCRLVAYSLEVGSGRQYLVVAPATVRAKIADL
jgi:hypothetical protein